MMDLRRYPLDEQNCTLEIESCEYLLHFLIDYRLLSFIDGAVLFTFKFLCLNYTVHPFLSMQTVCSFSFVQSTVRNYVSLGPSNLSFTAVQGFTQDFNIL